MDGAGPIRAGVLGPTSLAVGRHTVDLGPVRPRLVLAKLVLNAGQVVRPEQLADIVWPHERPSSWGVQLQSAVMVVRKALSGAGCVDAKLVLATTGGGYRFDVDPAHTDLGRFRAVMAAAADAQRTGDPAAALRHLRRAEALWRGPALADVRTHGMEAEAQRLDDQLLGVMEQRLELEDDTAGRLDELAELTERCPWRERLHELLMTALWRHGRAADALAHYRALHARYVDELGIEPGSRLAELHHRILDQARRPPTPPPAPVGVPHQLPPAVPHLVGRDSLVATAVARLRGPSSPGAAAVVVLYGPAGIGKTACAAAAAHAVAADFPDGQVFVRLRDAAGRAAGPREAVAQVLRALHGPDVEVPGTVAEAAANLRTSTFGRRVLLWLEDVTDLSVVRQLLPASPTCAVLVTSRPPLVGLEQATHLRVPPLDEEPARGLLVALMGSASGSGSSGSASGSGSSSGGGGSDSEVLRSVVLRCSGLPLALRIVGSRLAVGGPATLEAAARALDEDGEHLDWLVAGDLDLRGTLRFALSDAGAAARRLFELLTAVGVTQLPTWAAAALLDADEDTAGRAAHELAHLGLVETDHDGVLVHALVLAFAASLPAESPPAAALGRVAAAAVHLVSVADELIPHGSAVAAGLPVPDAAPTPAALAAVRRDPPGWLDRHLPVLLAVGTADVEPRLRATLAVRLNGHLAIRDAHEQRMRLFDSLGDLAGVPAELAARVWQSRFAAAAQHGDDPATLRTMAKHVVEAATAAGSETMARSGRFQLALAAHRDGALAEAEESYRQALAGAGHDSRAKALCGLGVVLRDAGRAPEAVRVISEAVAELNPAASRVRAILLVDLATALADLGNHTHAGTTLDEARRIIDELGDELGSAHVAVVAARVHAQRAEWTDADREITLAATVARQHPAGELRHLVAHAEAELAHHRGDPAGAAALLARAIDDATTTGDRLSLLRAHRLNAALGPPG